ncbi:28S ribosomal protein S21, mitochondrial isoform X1 [Harpia harpyja]|uniref:28S ribosomal protein S21, mitochondrial isoform X1 n=1 Tax=Harpia harpyja TaxID=202280 RepID=UPI0022B0A9DC|nr:28S ribosomal protein S21, mitochondrial isoform X1 [Harpia harpyja]
MPAPAAPPPPAQGTPPPTAKPRPVAPPPTPPKTEWSRKRPGGLDRAPPELSSSPRGGKRPRKGDGGDAPPSDGDRLFAQKCQELRGFIRPLAELLEGLRRGRYDRGLSSFQQSVAMDRIQRIIGVLQKPEMGAAAAMANHLRFLGRTVMVQNGNVEAAYGALNRPRKLFPLALHPAANLIELNGILPQIGRKVGRNVGSGVTGGLEGWRSVRVPHKGRGGSCTVTCCSCHLPCPPSFITA